MINVFTSSWMNWKYDRVIFTETGQQVQNNFKMIGVVHIVGTMDRYLSELFLTDFKVC